MLPIIATINGFFHLPIHTASSANIVGVDYQDPHQTPALGSFVDSFVVQGAVRDRLSRLTSFSHRIEDWAKMRLHGKQRWHDVTLPITPKTIVFPGDPVFEVQDICSLATGDGYGLQRMNLGNHAGTHIDFPSHVLKDAKKSQDYVITDLIGDGVVIEWPEGERIISRTLLERLGSVIRSGDIVFFKTPNSRLWQNERFQEDFVYMEPNAASLLVEKRVKMVGIDYISIDASHADDLPVHHLLLEKDILIVEGLNLSSVSKGRCQIFCIPLNIPNMDGVPARVLVQK